eukprot:UN28536
MEEINAVVEDCRKNDFKVSWYLENYHETITHRTEYFERVKRVAGHDGENVRWINENWAKDIKVTTKYSTSRHRRTGTIKYIDKSDEFVPNPHFLLTRITFDKKVIRWPSTYVSTFNRWCDDNTDDIKNSRNKTYTFKTPHRMVVEWTAGSLPDHFKEPNAGCRSTCCCMGFYYNEQILQSINEEKYKYVLVSTERWE